jgi:MerR family transcriptional regulator, light-induced transcriptional regulator
VPEALLHIGELSRRTGLSTDVIRAWERRYDLLQPQRTNGNFRLYTAADVSRLRLMQHYLAKGLRAGQAAGLVHRVQTAALSENPGLPAVDVRKALGVLRDSLESFDEGPAARVLERLLGVFAPGVVLRDVVLPYLRDVGERWACGTATIAQEHFASSFLEGWMLGMAHAWSTTGRRRAVLACAPGERHALGLIAFGLCLREAGWRVTYLGTDVPTTAVGHAADVVRADVIVLSVALTATFSTACDDIRALAREHPVAVGGAGVSDDPSAWSATRTLPADPIVAAHALSAHLGTALSDRRRPRARAASR